MIDRVTAIERAFVPAHSGECAHQRFHFAIPFGLQPLLNVHEVGATLEIRAGLGPNRATPIIALTANILPEHVERCHAAGMNDHVAKPIEFNTLIEAINRHTVSANAATDSLAA